MGYGKHEFDRYEGANWYDRLIDRVGLEAARDELKWRGAVNCPLKIEKAEIERFEHEVRQKCTISICTLAIMVLLDEFEFKAPEIQKFINRFNSKTDCIADDMVSWPDFREAILEETGIDVDSNEILWRTDTEEYKKWRQKCKNE